MQFRMLRQKLLDSLFDQVLYLNAAEGAGKLELSVYRLGDTGAERGFGLGVTAGPTGIGSKRTGFYNSFLWGVGHREWLNCYLPSLLAREITSFYACCQDCVLVRS